MAIHLDSGTSHDTLAAVFEALPFGVLLVDRATENVRFANSRWIELFGVRPAPGQTLASLGARVSFEHPDGTPYPYEDLATATTLRTGQPCERGDLVTRRPDGTRMPVVVTALPLSLAGGEAFDSVIAVVQDRREFARAFEQAQEWEERFELGAESGRQIAYEFDRVKDVARWSRSVESVLGYRREELTRDVYLAQRLMHPDDRTQVDAMFEPLRTGRRSDFLVEYRMRHADGRWLVIQDSGRAVRDEAGRVVRILGVMVDVTARREMERQIEHTQRLETVGTLAGGIAHDFNNQLTAVIGHLDLLDDAFRGDATASAHLGPARVAAQRCADLTRSLLTFSRRMEPLVEVVRPEAVVNEALAFAQRSLPASIRIETGIDPAPWPIEADAGQLEQVLLNLFVNARDAMRGTGALHVTVRNVEVDAERAARRPDARCGAFVEIAVGDSGCGIAPEVMPRIFEPFFTTKRVGEGTGLGLAMVHGIVHAHRGWIEVESVPGQSTWFRVMLPRAARARVDGHGAAEATVLVAGSTVLVVDDEPLVRDLIANLLTAAGCQPMTCPNGQMALELLGNRSLDFAVAIVDMTMPDMNGVELMEAMQEVRPDLPVVLSSGYSTESLPKGAGAAAGFLAKPYGGAQLLMLLGRVLARRTVPAPVPAPPGR